MDELTGFHMATEALKIAGRHRNNKKLHKEALHVLLDGVLLDDNVPCATDMARYEEICFADRIVYAIVEDTKH
jgi:hypothetical protein